LAGKNENLSGRDKTLEKEKRKQLNEGYFSLLPLPPPTVSVKPNVGLRGLSKAYFIRGKGGII
jgi:hypothetical protein